MPMYSVCTCIYTVCTLICNVHTCFNQLSQQQILVGILVVYTYIYTMVDSCMIALYIPNITYVKGSTGEYAVANTVVVHANNMWHPCTVYVHVYTLYVQEYMQCTYMF
jgi:hypothetical protein